MMQLAEHPAKLSAALSCAYDVMKFGELPASTAAGADAAQRRSALLVKVLHVMSISSAVNGAFSLCIDSGQPCRGAALRWAGDSGNNADGCFF